jgi:fructoselysine-6-P-deglycase FrlB-like protein
MNKNMKQFYKDRREHFKAVARDDRAKRKSVAKMSRNLPNPAITFFMGVGMGTSLPVIAYVAYELAILYGFNL